MKTTRRNELKARKQAYVQDEILAVAAELFAERGFRAVTLDDVSASLGYTKAVVYYYFKNKNQLLWEIFKKIHETWWEEMQAIVTRDTPADEQLAAMIRQMALNVMDKREWTAIYFRDQSELTEEQSAIVIEHKREFDRLFSSTYSRGVKAGIFKDIPPYVVVTSIVGMCTFTHTWYKPNRALKPSDIADHFITMVLDGCRNRSHPEISLQDAGAIAR
ncbi:TetR/AcrR family transcriptional regulator [Shinella daejeonensis]|uniref:TetR/AcrR family transcriptional regulator n=1 Tax=Shinella daejeonensis TaxID=659017 RepID=UPI0020C790D5|nr:TetR/AcrR family transcriptional regulator [Shinella daejeonensis]MCP8897463.1 TetR/AcrR family transcriptional regulator [Shinella daejeonensis]